MAILFISVLIYFSWPLVAPVKISPPFQQQYVVPTTILKTGGYPDTAKGVLEEYLRIDAEGGYLSNEGLEYLKTLSPANSSMRFHMLNTMIVQGYSVRYLKNEPELVVAEVVYDQIGELKHLDWFLPTRIDYNRTKKKQLIKLVSKDGRWVVSSKLLYAYISVPTALKYVEMATELAKTNKTAPRFIVEGAGELISQLEMLQKNSP